jgi:hypothetical protein
MTPKRSPAFFAQGRLNGDHLFFTFTAQKPFAGFKLPRTHNAVRPGGEQNIQYAFCNFLQAHKLYTIFYKFFPPFIYAFMDIILQYVPKTFFFVP